MYDLPPVKQSERDLWRAIANAMWPIGYVPADCLVAAKCAGQQGRGTADGGPMCCTTPVSPPKS
jgi:hypothetical protein